jgi:hypothetical protein
MKRRKLTRLQKLTCNGPFAFTGPQLLNALTVHHVEWNFEFPIMRAGTSIGNRREPPCFTTWIVRKQAHAAALGTGFGN